MLVSRNVLGDQPATQTREAVYQRKYFPRAGLVWALHQRPPIHQPELQVRSGTRGGHEGVNVSHWQAIATQLMYLYSTHAQTHFLWDGRVHTHGKVIHLILLFLHSAPCLSKARKLKRIFQTVTSFLSFKLPALFLKPNVNLSPSPSPFCAFRSFVSLSLLSSIFCLLKWCCGLDLDVMEPQPSTAVLCLLALHTPPPPRPGLDPSFWFCLPSSPPLPALSDGFQRGTVPVALKTLLALM